MKTGWPNKYVPVKTCLAVHAVISVDNRKTENYHARIIGVSFIWRFRSERKHHGDNSMAPVQSRLFTRVSVVGNARKYLFCGNPGDSSGSPE